MEHFKSAPAMKTMVTAEEGKYLQVNWPKSLKSTWSVVKMRTRNYLSRRDNSMMLRIKMSRRRSQVLRENRARVVNARRQLHSGQVLERNTQQPKNEAVEERLKNMQIWKDRKALEKEKERRTKKPVFKTGLYHPIDIFPFRPPVQAAFGKAKEPLKLQDADTAENKLQPPVEGTSGTRGAASNPLPGQTTVPARIQGERISILSRNPVLSEEETATEQTITDPAPTKEVLNSSPDEASFAPEGFLFQTPLGVNSKFEFMTPRSVDVFLTPSSNFTPPPAPVFDDPEAAEGKPSPKSLCRTPHDVPYFRAEIAIETDRLTGLCAQWEPQVDEESIPEEMRDRMRTAVGLARLLMKERFNQFSGLVDDYEFGRSEKMTTCTDLKGFWDMVYLQVEDINKKFDALKAAEACGWVEEHKPPPRQRKVVKKPAPAPSEPAGTKAAAKSHLAAAKAAMKVRQQAATLKKND